MQKQLAKQDLRFNDGVQAALELQGIIKGLEQAVETFLDIANGEWENG